MCKVQALDKIFSGGGNFFGPPDKISGHYVPVMSADLQYFSNITRIKSCNI